MTSSRIPKDKDPRFGRLIDRDAPLAFTFNGKKLKGFAGDTLASALLANGVRTLARSVKYHRPRGIMSVGADDPNAIVQTGTGDLRTPNQNATRIPLEAGLAVASQNAWPSLGFDAGALLERARPLMPPGFQYKAFKRPLKAWRAYEKAIRKIAGYGTAPDKPDPDRYEHVNAHADVLIVGGGIAGLAAAEAAASEGLKVFLAEAAPRLGGIADAYEGRIDGMPVLDWVRRTAAKLAAAENVHLLVHAEVSGLYDHGLAVIVENVTPDTRPEEAGNMPRQRLWKLRAKAVVLATGAFEKPLVFPENDRPGIMLATSARLYLRRYGVVPGQKIVIATSSDEGYRTATDLAAAGADISRIVDLRIAPDGALFHMVKSGGQSISVASAPVSTRGKGTRGITDVTIANRLTVDGPALRSVMSCDTLLVSGGWAPAPMLAGHLGARLSFDRELGAFRPGDVPKGLIVAGAANGKFDLALAVGDGWRGGVEAARHILGAAAREAGFSAAVEATQDDPAEAIGSLPDISTPEERLRAFVDVQTDTTVGDMEIAVREGYGAPEHLKRYTGLGLGTDQGKSSVANAAAILPRLGGTAADSSAHTTFRPPWTPIAFGAIAGARRGPLFRPVRTTPLTHLFGDAILEPLGLWRLPAAFPQPGETRENAIRREVRTVRGGIGIFDASAGAKILVSGTGAGEFLDRMSATDVGDTPIGTSRYALFLNEEGFVIEDGIVARLREDRFLVSTGVGRAASLSGWFERWHQTLLRDLDVFIVDETERWAQILLAGPQVPELLSRIPGDIDISSFTVDSFAEGDVNGAPARALASRYTAGAEVELSIPAGNAPAFWNFLLEAGRDIGVARFGMDAMQRLRLEAGAFDLDRETDGTVTPYDLGLGDLVSSESDFIGRSGLERPALTRPNRRHLVGVLLDDKMLTPPPGSHLILDPEEPTPRRVVGHITTSGYSPTLRRSLALALVSAGEKHLGDRVFVMMTGDAHGAEITVTDFLGTVGDDA